MKAKITCILLLCAANLYAQTNTATGTNAGNTGSENSSFGYVAGDVVTGGQNTFIGAYSGYASTSASRNAFIGYATGRFNTTGGYNVFLGSDAGYKNTTGSQNVFLGYAAGYSLISGTNNVFLGVNAGYANTIGVGNVFIGTSAGFNEAGSNKLYIDNSSTSLPLIYGDFATNKVGINKIPDYTFDVDGSINATSLYVNGSLIKLWASSGSNISYSAGIVSIGTTTAPIGYKLAIGGKAVAEEIVVKLQGNWPDYVFATDYKLPSLAELERFIKEEKHLPGVPTAEEVKENGVAVGEMNAILLKKIEELTLLMIEQQKVINEQGKRLQVLETNTSKN